MTKTSSPFVVAVKQMVIIPLSALLIFLFSTKLVAQKQEPPKKQALPKQDPGETLTNAPIPFSFAGMSIGYTKEGASPGLMKEYEDIVNKYKSAETPGWKDFKSITREDRLRLETIFKQMSIQQQTAQLITFTKNPPPLSKVVPTQKELEQYKKPDVYGIWINDKKVPNSALNEYKNTDFSQVFVSKLYGAATKGRPYTHQVNMMTNDYYDRHLTEALANAKKTNMIFMTRRGKGVGMLRIN